MFLIHVPPFLEWEQAIVDKKTAIPQARILRWGNYEKATYAILSHRWLEDTAEVKYEEMDGLANMDPKKRDEIRNRDGYQKILKSCKQAKKDGYEWLWADTCCIDKRSSAELSEAINSMYRWYEKSARCYAYLHDVPSVRSFPTKPNTDNPCEFKGWPEWFSRGWTLQELIAPHDVRFFNENWQFIGDKEGCCETLHDITRIPQNVLTNGLSFTTRPCVAQIMSWAADRSTSRVEDRAYSLMGLLDVNMPMLYGEGEKAFERLQLEVIRKSNDQSIFAWEPEEVIGRSGSVLADNPSFFRDCFDLQTMEIDEFTKALGVPMSKEEEEGLGAFAITNRGIQIWLPLRPCSGSSTVVKATLQCRRAAEQRPVTIYLTLWKSNYYRSFGPRSGDAFAVKEVLRFEQLHLRYQDVVYHDPVFEFDDEAVSKLGLSCSDAKFIRPNSVYLHSSNPLCVGTYVSSQHNSRFSVGFGQCFGQVWIHVMDSDEGNATEEYNKMLITGPEHAKSMAETYPGPSHICIKHTRLPRCTVRTSCVMWKDSRESYPVRIEAIDHPGSCPCSEKKAHDRIASLDLGHQVSLDTRIVSSTYGDVYKGTLILSGEQTEASGNGTKETPNPQEERAVAVKVVRYDNKDVLMKILGEIYVWCNLENENLVKLLGITAAFDHTISIVSPLMVRKDAFRHVQDPGVNPRPLILGIAKGLDYLHKRKLSHGGIKGANVLISDDGRALLTDFGSSRLAEASFSLVVKGDQKGALDWMAPEHFQQNKFTISTESDVWAFGMTTLELLTKQRPFHHLQNIGAIISHIMDEKLTGLDASLSYLTDEWKEILLLCCKYRPDERPKMSKVVEAINTLQTQTHTKSEVDAGPSYDDDRFRLLDVTERLNEVATWASDHNIQHFNNFALDNNAFYALKGFSTVKSGILQLKEGNTVRDVKVAIKTPRFIWDKEAIEIFLKEVYVWSNLQHDNVLPFIGIMSHRQTGISVISPWMEKGSARDYVQNESVDPCPLIKGIASGLCYLHSNNPHCDRVYHGDMKGLNVFISEEGQARIGGFHLSSLVDPSPDISLNARQIAGSLPWMAPEMLDGRKATVEQDVWAFAMTALELFTRKDPFHPSSDPIQIMAKIKEGLPDRPSSRHLTDEWWDLCCECWNPDPSVRPTMQQVVEEIQ